MMYIESIDSTVRMADSWNSRFAFRASRRIFISREPLPSAFFKVNFDDSIMASVGGASFVIKDLQSRLVVVGGNRLFSHSALEAELQVAWIGIV